MAGTENEPEEREDAGEEEPVELPEGEYWKTGDETPAAPTLEDLVAILRKGDPVACEQAVAQLSDMGDTALPALRALLEDDNADVRVDAAKAIALITEL